MSDIGVTYEELSGGAESCTSCGADLHARLDSLKASLEGMGWQGSASDAFQGMFAAMHTQLVGVDEQLQSVAEMLRSTASGYEEMETGFASGFSGSAG